MTGNIRFANVAAINYNKTYTGSPKATGNYIDLGVLVKYTVKDGVYTLTDAAETDGADLTVAYVQGAATMKIANKNYAGYRRFHRLLSVQGRDRC